MRLAILGSIASTSVVLAQTATTAKPDAKQPVKAAASTQQPDIGERKFNANCSRCHTAPQTLSPSLTGTVVRHMRVRAILSAQDEKDILKYLAP
jgi:mono/diheme cytochrome c family protein